MVVVVEVEVTLSHPHPHPLSLSLSLPLSLYHGYLKSGSYTHTSQYGSQWNFGLMMSEYKSLLTFPAA